VSLQLSYLGNGLTPEIYQRQRHGWHAPVSGQCPYGWPALRHAVDERKPKRWRRNAARRSGIAIRLNRANGTYSAA
jgi:hypothetical protein